MEQTNVWVPLSVLKEKIQQNISFGCLPKEILQKILISCGPVDISIISLTSHYFNQLCSNLFLKELVLSKSYSKPRCTVCQSLTIENQDHLVVCDFIISCLVCFKEIKNGDMKEHLNEHKNEKFKILLPKNNEHNQQIEPRFQKTKPLDMNQNIIHMRNLHEIRSKTEEAQLIECYLEGQMVEESIRDLVSQCRKSSLQENTP